MDNPDNITENKKTIIESLIKGNLVGIPNSEQIRMEEASTWGPERTISARFIRELCTDPDIVNKLQPHGIRIRGVRIDGGLDLNSLNIPFNISLLECFIPHVIDLRRATATALDLSGSRTVSIEADKLTVLGNMLLGDGFSADGYVCLIGAIIKGDLNCVRGHFDNKSVQKDTTNITGCVDCRTSTLHAYSLVLERANIEGSLHLCGGFTAKGGVNLMDATIGVNLNGTKGTFSARTLEANQEGKNTGRRLACEADAEHHLACAFNGEGMHVKRNLILNCIDVKGEMRLTGAFVDGDLDSADGKYTNHGGNAIHADRLHIRGNIFFSDGFKTEGAVRLPRAEIGSDLSFCRSLLTNVKENIVTLYCEGIKVKGTVYMRNTEVKDGCVDLSYSSIGGNLDCTDGKFLNPGGWAIKGHGMVIRGSAFLCSSSHGRKFKTDGLVSLTGSKLDMDLICTDGSFKSVKPCALEEHTPCAIKADNMSIGGKVEMNGEGFVAEGGVNLDDSTIGSFLRCDHGTFVAPSMEGNFNCAISAGKLQVGGSIYLQDGFKSFGQVMLNDVSIGRNLNCTQGMINNEGGFTLQALQMKVAGSVNMKDGFVSHGEVQINFATIGGNLDCAKGEFINNKEKKPQQEVLDDKRGKRYAFRADGVKIVGSASFTGDFHADGIVSLQNADIGMCLHWKDVRDSAKASLHLDSTRVGVLEDAEDSWPEKNNLQINGFEYEFLKDLSADGLKMRREKWLRLPVEFRTQPFEHLAAVLKRSGYEEDAREVLIAKNKIQARLPTRWFWADMLRRRCPLKDECSQSQSPLTRIKQLLLESLVCYGYKPTRALIIGLVFVLAGWWLFYMGFGNGLMIPTKDKGKDYIYQTATIWSEFNDKDLKNIEEGIGLYSLIYTLDTFLPVIDLHTRDYWLPTVKPPQELSHNHLFPEWLNSVGSEKKDGFLEGVGLVLCVYRWVLKFVGWVVTSFFVAAMTGIVRR